MKLLLDTCVWGGAATALREHGHDVVWAGAWDCDPGDQEILRLAHVEQRVLVTLDKDFGELAIVFEHPHEGILRLVNIPARRQDEFIHYVIDRHESDLSAGEIATIDANRFRIRSRGESVPGPRPIRSGRIPVCALTQAIGSH